MVGLATTAFGRMGTISRFETYVEVTPGTWDIADPTQPSVADDVNKYLENNGGQLMDARVEPRLIEVKDNGRQRIFLVTATFIYLPKERITDGREAQTYNQAGKEESASGSGIQERNFPGVRDPGSIPFDSLLRSFGVDPEQAKLVDSQGRGIVGPGG